MNKFPLYRSAVGLVDKLDALRVPYNAETGVLGLSEANNVHLDITGAIIRRDGYALLYSGAWDNIFSCDSYALGTLGTSLCLINADLTYSVLTTVVVGVEIAYTRVFNGADDIVYFSTGVSTGIIRNKAYEAWTVPAYVGVNFTEMQIRKFMPSVPTGQVLCPFNGRLYIAKGNLLYYSEASFNYSWYDETRYLVFRKNINAVRAVATGLYVSTEDELIFMPGNSPDDFGSLVVYRPGMIKGTDVSTTGSAVGLQSRGDVVFFAVSGRGLCYADEQGVVFNYSEDKIDFPVASRGAAYINNGKQYIVTIF